MKIRDISLPTKVCTVRAMFFSSNRVWIWELDYKEGLPLKNGCFQTVVLEKTLLRVPWKARRWSQSILKKINPEYLLEELLMKLQYFGPICEEPTNWKRPRSWKTKDKRKWLDSITESMEINLSKFQEIVKDKKAWCVEVHGVTKNWTWLNNSIICSNMDGPRDYPTKWSKSERKRQISGYHLHVKSKI